MPLTIKRTNTVIAAANSVQFNGSNYLNCGSNTLFSFGTGNFTVEGWMYLTTMGVYNTLFSNGTAVAGAVGLYTLTNNKLSFAEYYGTDVNGSTTLSINTWYHVAVTRSGSTVRLFLNGNIENSNASDSFNNTTNNLIIGSVWGTAADGRMNGYISNFRIVKGTALYTAAFTPSTSPLTAIANTSILTCHDTTIRDASVNNFTITNNNTATVSSVAPFTAVLASSMKFKKTITTRIGRSVLFDGTNQYLSLPNTGALNLGSNNFTIEAWVYPTSVSGNKNIFYINGNASSYSAICLYIQNSKFAFLANQTGGYPWTLQIGEVGPTISSNTWYHVATTRSGNSFYVFVNGTLVSGAPYSLSGALFNGTINSIGYQATIASYFTGYISNARIINGTALYTASFSVPTAPLTAIANTQLLTCNAPTIVDSSSNNFTITNNNAATVSTTNPFGADTVSGTFKVKKSAGVYMVATGGDLVTTSGSYKVHTFTTVGTSSFTISSIGSTPSVEYLIVGGGGAGGSNNNCGGGGAGGLIYNTASLSVGAYAVTVGQSGSVASGVSNGNNGGNSTFNGLVAFGGGGGGGSTAGSNGGSGGGNGGGGFGGTDSGGGAGLQPTSSYGGFGNKGGFSAGASSYPGGGGGGAGAAGNNGSGATGGNGGVGKAYAFAGALTYYAGGGGGSLNPGTAGTGGLGGGGNGRSTIGVGIAATGYGSGGGGGLSAGSGGEGGAGSPGIILIKYRYTD